VLIEVQYGCYKEINGNLDSIKELLVCKNRKNGGLCKQPPEVYEAHRLETMLEDINCKQLLADKAYDTAANRELLKANKINNRILKKAVRNKPLTKRQKRRNILISKTRYKVERCFGTMKRKFNFARASYFSTVKVNAQALLKAICFNALKAVNMMA
jgi:transposase, IS5 family